MTKSNMTAPDNSRGAIECLFDNLDLIIKNKNIILGQKQYSDIKIPKMHFGGSHIGGFELCLGDILVLWDTTNWHDGNRYYYSISGSPLSGNNIAKWYDTESKQYFSGIYHNGGVGFAGLASPALKYLKQRKDQSDTNIQYPEISIWKLVDILKAKKI